MRVIEPGHIYELDNYSPQEGETVHKGQTQTFFKKIGDKYPGNEPPEHEGTNCQESIRILIDRVKYLHKQDPCIENREILINLRDALFNFERRAARIRGNFKRFAKEIATSELNIEDIPACHICGHIACERHP